MPRLSLSLYRVTLGRGSAARIPGCGAAAVLVHEGAARIGDTRLTEGGGLFAPSGAAMVAQGYAPAVGLAFVLSEAPADTGAVASEEFDMSFPCLLRLDEVAFPPGVQAYRHVHPGPGFRYLRWGALHLEADDHAFDAEAGTVWFEPACSPVRATASASEPETRFVRCMVLPPEFQGKPTIKILDPQDALRPMKQTTLRHVDQWLGSLAQGDAG